MILTNVNIATMDGPDYGLITDAAIRFERGRIAWIGRNGDETPRESGENIRESRENIRECGGKLLTPGLIDCHTHLVYGGNRADEFEKRLNGVPYAEIAKAGGGILSTVRATREASEDDLTSSALSRLDRLLAEGVTTVEVKSGYGLDTETEIKMLEVARTLARKRAVDVVTSFLGAHAIPPEHKDQRTEYVRIICDEMLPAIHHHKLADAVDAFCEGIAFSVEETAQVFEAARKLGIPVKLHADQLSNLGGAKLAASFDALSVDHLEYTDDEGVEAIAKSGTVATLLPGAFYYLREKQHPPVASLRKHGVAIALATDLNPGSSPVHSLLATMNMGCVLFGLTPEEALRGVTVNAARALGLKDRGLIATGMKADLALWDVARPGDLAYPLGLNPCTAVIKDGLLVRGSL
jgi:imidazolonepropionase